MHRLTLKRGRDSDDEGSVNDDSSHPGDGSGTAAGSTETGGEDTGRAAQQAGQEVALRLERPSGGYCGGQWGGNRKQGRLADGVG